MFINPISIRDAIKHRAPTEHYCVYLSSGDAIIYRSEPNRISNYLKLSERSMEIRWFELSYHSEHSVPIGVHKWRAVVISSSPFDPTFLSNPPPDNKRLYWHHCLHICCAANNRHSPEFLVPYPGGRPNFYTAAVSYKNLFRRLVYHMVGHSLFALLLILQ